MEDPSLLQPVTTDRIVRCGGNVPEPAQCVQAQRLPHTPPAPLRGTHPGALPPLAPQSQPRQ